MKKAVLTALMFAPLAAMASSTYDVARVESVTPQYEQVRVQGPCRVVTTVEEAQPSTGTGGSIIGGVVGGLLGNQVGGGNGRTVATAAGAIAGAIVGGNMDRNSPGQPTTVRRQICEQDSWDRQLTGYVVNYDYHGTRGSVVMPRDPGRTINVRVSVEPLAQ